MLVWEVFGDEGVDFGEYLLFGFVVGMMCVYVYVEGFGFEFCVFVVGDDGLSCCL